MSRISDQDRLFSEREVGALMQRATELQGQSAEPDAGRGGLTYAEVEQLAAELGIHPDHLRAALDERVERDAHSPLARLAGGPFDVVLRRAVTGTLDDATWHAIVQELRTATHSTGTLNDIGSTREWTRVVEGRERTHVALTEREGRVTIALDASYQSGVAMIYSLSFILGVTITGIMLDGAGLPDLANFAIAAGGGAGGMGAARGGVVLWLRSQRKKLTRMIDRLQRIAGAPPEAAPMEGLASPASEPMPERPIDEAPPASTSTRPRTRS